MKYKLLLGRNENIKKIEEQEQARFVKSSLEVLGVPNNFNPDEPLSIEGKINFKKILDEYNINIIDDMDGGIKIYVGTDLAAEWKKVSYKLKINNKQKLCTEMEVNIWNALDEQQGG